MLFNLGFHLGTQSPASTYTWPESWAWRPASPSSVSQLCDLEQVTPLLWASVSPSVKADSKSRGQIVLGSITEQGDEVERNT